MMRTSLFYAIEIVVQSCAWLVLFSLFSRQDSDVRDTVKLAAKKNLDFLKFGKIDSYSLEYLLEV